MVNIKLLHLSKVFYNVSHTHTHKPLIPQQHFKCLVTSFLNVSVSCQLYLASVLFYCEKVTLLLLSLVVKDKLIPH